MSNINNSDYSRPNDTSILIDNGEIREIKETEYILENSNPVVNHNRNRRNNNFHCLRKIMNYIKIIIICLGMLFVSTACLSIIVTLLGTIGHFPYFFDDGYYGDCLPITKIIYTTNCNYSFERIKFIFVAIGISNIIELALYVFVSYGFLGFGYLSINYLIYIYESLNHITNVR
jgi:hypothetical protein